MRKNILLVVVVGLLVAIGMAVMGVFLLELDDGEQIVFLSATTGVGTAGMVGAVLYLRWYGGYQARTIIARSRYGTPRPGQEPLLLRASAVYTPENLQEMAFYFSTTQGGRFTIPVAMLVCAVLLVMGIVQGWWFVVMPVIAFLIVFPIRVWLQSRHVANDRRNTGTAEFFFYTNYFTKVFHGELARSEEMVPFHKISWVTETGTAFYFTTKGRVRLTHLLPKERMEPDMQQWLRAYLLERFPTTYSRHHPSE